MTLSTHLELGITKISLILGITILLGSCNAVKNVTQDQLLLTKNTIEVDGQEIIDAKWFDIKDLPNTPPNSTLSGRLINSYILDR